MIDSVRRNLLSQFDNLRLWPKAAVFRQADLSYSITDVPLANFNSIHQHRPTIIPALVPEIANLYRAAGVPAIWRLWPEQAEMSEKLAAVGFAYQGSAAAMVLDLASLPTMPPVKGLDIRPAALSDWAGPFVAGFGMPDFAAAAYLDFYQYLGDKPLYHFAGWVDGQPVAAASLWLGGGSAGLYNVAVVPGMRGRGIGTAISVAALGLAIQSGCKLATLQASEAGKGLYSRLGFREVGKIRHHIFEGG